LQTNVSAKANESQPDEENCNLHKANYRAAIPCKQVGLGANYKNEQTDKCGDGAD
jgi:hypothetical protein